MPRMKTQPLIRYQADFEELLDRLEKLVPIVWQQQRDADRAAEEEYYANYPERRKPLGIMDMRDIHEMPLATVQTPEAVELDAIGHALAAFGGREAITEIGWALGKRVAGPAGHFPWYRWDGFGDFYM